MATNEPKRILLGEGVFAINGVDIGLVRGGGQFTVEREYRVIEADGDRGPVKGRVRLVGSVAKLTMNALELMAENLPKILPATKLTKENDVETFEAKQDIEYSDFVDEVTWTGRTLDGKAVVISIQNAINLENIDWNMSDKDEVVQTVTYTGTYDEEHRLGTKEPWKVTFAESV